MGSLLNARLAHPDDYVLLASEEEKKKVKEEPRLCYVPMFQGRLATFGELEGSQMQKGKDAQVERVGTLTCDKTTCHVYLQRYLFSRKAAVVLTDHGLASLKAQREGKCDHAYGPIMFRLVTSDGIELLQVFQLLSARHSLSLRELKSGDRRVYKESIVSTNPETDIVQLVRDAFRKSRPREENWDYWPRFQPQIHFLT